jgi:MerR family transcriptional regulator, light-induced transcriptional regulator
MAQPLPLAQLSASPVFNTKAVARETGVPADTFRAWERRYGVPRPQRTAGGHRLYSERDIATIRWLRDRTDEGVNISHAVMLLTNTLDATEVMPDGNDEARAFRQLTDQIVEALAIFNIPQADQILSEAFSIYPLERVLLELVQPAMVEIGERWHRGAINVAVEHFATQFIRRKLASLLTIFEGGAHRATIVVGCAPGELHDLGALLSALFLVRRGWHVIYLGPQVPLFDLLETVEAVKPSLVCLSASTMETALELIPVARGLAQAYPWLHVGYGGRVFNVNPELRHSMPGIFLGQDARELVDIAVQLLSRGSSPASE